MTVAGGEAIERPETRGEERRAAAVACGAHALHDGYTDLIVVMLPIWQAEFGLGYGELGLMRGMFAGTMATFQIPAGLLAERLGTPLVLAGGTALAGLGYCLAGASAALRFCCALVIGGLGASTQHPLASALMAHAFAGARSMKALGTYNFAGDIGKMTVPAVASVMLVAMPWRPVLALIGACGLVAAAAIYLLTPRYSLSARPLPDTGGGRRDVGRASRLRIRSSSRSACSTARPAWASCCSCHLC
jgi:MFS family permease